MSGRNYPETQEALQKIQGALDTVYTKRSFPQRLFSFQTFASVLLLLVVVLSIVSLSIALHSEQEARARAELRQETAQERVEIFEGEVNTILSEIQVVQEHTDEQHADLDQLIRRIEENLDDL